MGTSFDGRASRPACAAGLAGHGGGVRGFPPWKVGLTLLAVTPQQKTSVANILPRNVAPFSLEDGCFLAARRPGLCTRCPGRTCQLFWDASPAKTHLGMKPLRCGPPSIHPFRPSISCPPSCRIARGSLAVAAPDPDPLLTAHTKATQTTKTSGGTETRRHASDLTACSAASSVAPS